jgi:hypothetical protein
VSLLSCTVWCVCILCANTQEAQDAAAASAAWPQQFDAVQPGLRLDAMDSRGMWYCGTVEQSDGTGRVTVTSVIATSEIVFCVNVICVCVALNVTVTVIRAINHFYFSHHS